MKYKTVFTQTSTYSYFNGYLKKALSCNKLDYNFKKAIVTTVKL